MALELVGIDEVLAERLLVPDRLGGPVGTHRIGVLAPGQRSQMGAARLAQATHQRVEGQGGQIAHRPHAEIVQPLGRRRSHSPQCLDVMGGEEGALAFGCHHHDAGSGLEPVT